MISIRCRSMQKHAEAFRSMQKHAETCRSMMAYDGIWWLCAVKCSVQTGSRTLSIPQHWFMSTAQSFSGSRSIDYSLHQGPLHGLRGCPQPLRAATAKHGRAGASGGGRQVHQTGVHHKAYGGQPNLDNISWQLKLWFAYMFVRFLWISTFHSTFHCLSTFWTCASFDGICTCTG